jgi:hypothetical protein
LLTQGVGCVWYVVVVTTTTCRQLGNDTTYDTEKKPTSHDVADTSAVSGRHDGKTQRHVVKTNCGRHLKWRHFQLSPELYHTLAKSSKVSFVRNNIKLLTSQEWAVIKKKVRSEHGRMGYQGNIAAIVAT